MEAYLSSVALRSAVRRLQAIPIATGVTGAATYQASLHLHGLETCTPRSIDVKTNHTNIDKHFMHHQGHEWIFPKRKQPLMAFIGSENHNIKGELMSELRDQNFQAGDWVVVLYDTVPHVTVVKEINNYGAVIVRDQYNNTVEFNQKGGKYIGSKQTLFHLDAITIDEHGRLTAINHDYVKPREPKIVTKEPHEFVPFEKVLVWDFYRRIWRIQLFIGHKEAFFITADKTYLFRNCIPFKGNERLKDTGIEGRD